MARARRIKFVWGNTAKYPEYRTLGLWLIDARAADPKIRGVVINLRALVAWALLGLAIAYVAATMQWYALQQRRPVCSITRVDALLLPLRWAAVREKTGRDLIAHGLTALQARRWGEAQVELRSGLSRAPHVTEARRALADLYMLGGRRSEAIAVLTDDLAHGYPGRDYLAQFIRIANDGEDFGVVLGVCDRFRASAPAADRPWLLAEEMRALLGTRRAAEVLARVPAGDELAGGDLREARVLALLQLQRPAEALAFLDAWRARPGANRVQVMRLRIQALREAGCIDEMVTSLRELCAFAPDQPRLRVIALVQLVCAGRSAEANAQLDDFLWRFGGEPQALSQAAAELGEVHALPLVSRCVAEAGTQGFAMRPFLQVLLDAQVDAADWVGAADTLARLEPLTVGSDLPDKFYLLWMQRLVAATGAEDGRRLALLEVLRDRPIPLRIFRRTVEAMIAAGRFETASAAGALGQRLYPASPTLRDLSQRAATLAAARPAPKAAPTVVVASVPSEAEFFAQVETLARTGRWDEAADLVRRVRALKPGWLASREPAVLLWAVRIAHRQDDVPEMLSAARLFLNGSAGRADQILALAREARGAGANDHALLLVNEVLRRVPGYAPAGELRAQWQPKVDHPS